MKQKRRLMMIMGALFILGLVGILTTYNAFIINPFSEITLENMSNITVANDNNLLVIHDSNRTVSKLSTDGDMVYTINGGVRDEVSFFFASEVDSDPEGNIYILNNQWDESGSYISDESIKVFDAKGKYIETAFTYTDETESHLRPVIKGLQWYGDGLRWFLLNPDAIEVYIGNSITNIPFDHADELVQDLTWQDGQTAIIISKQGLIYKLDLKALTLTVVEDFSGTDTNYLTVETDEAGKLYLDDVGNFKICDYPDCETVFRSSDFLEGHDLVYYNFDVFEGKIVAVNDEAIALKDTSGNYSEINSMKPSDTVMMYRMAIWISIVILLVTTVYWMRYFIKIIAVKGLPKGMARTFAMVLVIVVSTMLISSLAINFYSEILVSQATDGIKNIVQNARYVVNGDVLEDISYSSDFYGDAYQEIFEEIQMLINYNEDEWNEELYTALYTIKDERYYGLMYNDNGITPYYPFNAFTDDDYYYYFYDAYEGDITEGTVADADGEWLFSMGPIYDSEGNVIAIVEVGMNKYIFDEWNTSIMRRIVIDIISLVIIAVLLVSEINFFAVWYQERSVVIKSGKPGESAGYLGIIRTLALVTYVMIFMCTAFVPLMSKAMYTPIGNLPMSVAISLPIFAEVLTTAITIVIAGFVGEKKGWRILFYVGVIMLIASAFMTAFTRSLVLFIGIRALAGIGNGAIQMTMHSFVNTGKTVAIRNEVYANMMSGAVAGINLGVVLGANLSDKMGYHNVFFVIVGVGVLALLFQFLYMRKYQTLATEMEASDDVVHEPISFFKFISYRNIIVFFICVMIPAFLCYMYLEYFFPLFAERNGLSTSVVGIVFSLYGLFIVYFGPTMSTFTEKTFGVKRATMLASIITGLSLLIFAVTGSLVGAVFAVFVLAVSDSFGESVYTTYFLALEGSKRIGQSIAAGYLEFSSQIGKMLGTLAFGIAIGLGEKMGIGIIGTGTVAFGILFMLISKKDHT